MTAPDETWEDSQRLEADFWGACQNTFTEELKQLVYMDRMGFKRIHDGRGPYNWDGRGKSYIDIGGGPTSVVLKMVNATKRTVVDPCYYPDWVFARYHTCGIEVHRQKGEAIWVEPALLAFPYDVALIYNCLQHTESPDIIVSKARAIAAEIHMFEWIDLPAHPGHPHCLTEALLQEWTGQKGKTETFNGLNECFGRAWYC